MNSAIVTFVVIIFVLCIYAYLEQKTIRDINTAKQITLSNMEYRATDILKSSSNLVFQVFNDNNAIVIMTSRERSITNEIRLSTTIDNMMISHPFLQSVYICSKDSVVLRKNRDSYYDLEKEDAIFDFIYQNRILFPIKRSIPIVKGLTLDLFTIIYHSAYPHNEAMNGAVVLNIDAGEFYRNIAPEYIPEGSRLLVVDSAGHVASPSEDTPFLLDISEEEYIRKILASSERVGTLVQRKGKEKYAVNYVKSNTFDLIIVSVDPYGTIMTEMTRARMYILIVASSILAVSIISFFILTAAIFKPIRKLMINIRDDSELSKYINRSPGRNDEFLTISQTVSSMLQHINILEHREAESKYTLRNRFAFDLFNRVPGADEQKSIEKRMAEFDISFDPSAGFRVLIFRIDGYEALIATNSLKSKNLLLVSIGNIVAESFQSEFDCTAFESEGDHEVILLRHTGDKPNATASFESRISHIQEKVVGFLNISTTAALSSIYRGFEGLAPAYCQAMRLTRYRLFHGESQFFHEGRVPAASDHDYHQEKNDILAAIRANERSSFLRYFDELLNILKNESYDDSVNVLSELFVEIQKIGDDLITFEQQNEQKSLIEFITSIDSMESPRELKRWFTELYENVGDCLSDLNRIESRNLMKNAVEFLASNYSDGQLSGNLVAKRLSISPQYFSKLFVEYTGQSFPQYLNHIRLEKAREILETTDKPAQMISTEVGYYSRTYFSTLFKKAYGVSPAKYRIARVKNGFTRGI